MLCKKTMIQIPKDVPVDQFFEISLPAGSKILSVDNKDGVLTCKSPMDYTEQEIKQLILLSPEDNGATFEVPEGMDLRKIGKVQIGEQKCTLCELKEKHGCKC